MGKIFGANTRVFQGGDFISPEKYYENVWAGVELFDGVGRKRITNMFESIFGGDLNGQCIYDVDNWDDDYPRGGNKRSSGFDGAKLIARFNTETGKAMLYDIYGINKQTGELELAAQEWLPLKWVRNAPPPKTWPERMRDFVVVSVPSWLHNKKSWPKTHDMQVIHLIFHPQNQI